LVLSLLLFYDLIAKEPLLCDTGGKKNLKIIWRIRKHTSNSKQYVQRTAWCLSLSKIFT